MIQALIGEVENTGGLIGKDFPGEKILEWNEGQILINCAEGGVKGPHM